MGKTWEPRSACWQTPIDCIIMSDMKDYCPHHSGMEPLKNSNNGIEPPFITHQQSELTHYIDKAQLTFEAVRMIVVTH